MKIKINPVFVFTGLLTLGMFACDHPVTEKDRSLGDESEDILGIGEEGPVMMPPVQTYRLWHTVDQLDLRSFKYYGGFFDDRLKFYYALEPGLRIADAGVNLIMLYFLDDRLVKIRYHLNQDVTGSMMDSLGLGVLETRYNIRKTVFATPKALDRLREYNREKGRKDEFNIVWDRQIIESSYHVDPNPSSLYQFDTIKANFVYVDQLKSYRKNLIRLENELREKLVMSTEK